MVAQLGRHKALPLPRIIEMIQNENKFAAFSIHDKLKKITYRQITIDYMRANVVRK